MQHQKVGHRDRPSSIHVAFDVWNVTDNGSRRRDSQISTWPDVRRTPSSPIRIPFGCVRSGQAVVTLRLRRPIGSSLVRFDLPDSRRSSPADNEDVVLFVSGDVDADTGQRRHNAADVLTAKEDDARVVRPSESFDVFGQLRFRREFPDAFVVIRRVRCEGQHLVSKGLDDCLDGVCRVFVDPSFFARVALSIWNYCQLQDIFLEGGTVFDGPDQGRFREF